MSKVQLPFWIGLGGHIVFWLLVVNFDSTSMDCTCGEISCWVLVGAELPVSLLYLSGSAATVTVGSLVFGSLWWGVVLSVFVWLGKKLLTSSVAK